MFRRSRFCVRPNVSAGGRTTAGTSQEPPAGDQDNNKTQKESSESSSAATDKSDVTPSENAPAPGNSNDQNGEGTSSSASLQRRKRFSIKPKVAPGRAPTLSRMPKSPIKAVSATPADVSGSDTEKPSTSSKAGIQSPGRRRLSETIKQQNQPKLPLTSSKNSGPSSVSLVDDSPEQVHVPTGASKQTENISGSPVKEVPPRQSDRVPPSLPDKEASEISEKAKTLISSRNVVSVTQSAFCLSRLLNDPSDVQRLIKAQKLRELLKQERCKEKKLKKAKARQKEFTLDPTKMTMRDLIHYLPTANPMTSSLEDSLQEDEEVLPVSPRREKSPEKQQQPEAKTSSREEGEENAAAEEEQEEALMVPQVKVAEDGSLIIDEESLTVEVQRAKGPNPAQDREPIFERGSTTTYSSFRKAYYTKPWSIEETDMFFLAVSMVGTDFSMICQLFPHRARSEIKNKFKREERENSWRIDKAFREKRKLDIEFFSKLLEKVLEVQKDRRKLKLLAEKNTTKKTKTQTKCKKSTKKLSHVEEEDEDEVLESEDGGEKENEDQHNEGGIPASEPKKRTRKKRAKVLTEEPPDKKTKTGEDGIPEDSEAVLPEDHANTDMSETVQNKSKDTTIKSIKLSKGRAPKPALVSGLKQGQKDCPSRKDEEAASDKGEKSDKEEELDLSDASRKGSDGEDISSEEEETVVKPLKPTRYGRVPKPTQPLIYAPRDNPHSESESDSTQTKPKSRCNFKRGKTSKPQSNQKSKKPKLITLRSSKSDFSDGDSENEDKDGREGQQLPYSSGRGSESSANMASSLHPQNVVVSEVDESIVELDILESMPDVLGISQDALCPDSSCQEAQHETGTESCEHQLDLLVDVIDLLSSEHTEESQDESYNEAAQTLLTICSLTHVSQSTQSQITTQDYTGETASVVDEFSCPEEEIGPAAPEQSSTTSLSSVRADEVTEISQTVAAVELQSSVTDITPTETTDQICGELGNVCHTELTPQLKSNPESTNTNVPLMKTRHFSKVKPKPKTEQTSRTSQQISQTETSKEQKVKDTAAEEITSKSKESAHDTKKSDCMDERSKPLDETTKSGLMKSSTSNSTMTEAEQEPCTLSKSLQDSSSEHPPCALPAENVSASQKGEGEVVNPSQNRLSRLPKIKPKPNLPPTSRTTRMKSQETIEKDSLPGLKPGVLKQTIEEAQQQLTCTSSFKPTEELPSNEDIKPCVEVANQALLGTSDQSAKENQNISEVQPEELTAELTDEYRPSHIRTTEKRCKSVLSTDPTEPFARQGLKLELNLIQEGSGDPTTPVAAVEEKTVNKEETEVAPTCKLNWSRSQEVKPKPNLSKTSRGARSKPETTEKPEEDLSAGPNVGFNRMTVNDVTQQAECTPSSQSTDCVVNPVMASESFSPTENVSTDELEAQTEQSKMQTALDSGSNSEVQVKNLNSQRETSENGSNNTTTTVESGSVASKISSVSIDSPPVQEQKPVEEPACKQDHEVVSTHPSQRRRLQKIKPRPNLPQTARLKSQTTVKDSSPGPDLGSCKNTVDVEAQATCNFSPEKQDVSSDSASGVKLSLTSSCSVTSSEEGQTHAGLVDQNWNAAASDKSVFENQNLKLESNADRDTPKSSEFIDQNMTNPVCKSNNSCDNEVLTDQAITQSQICQGSSSYPAPSDELSVSKEKEEDAFTCQLKRSRSQKVKPKPNLPQISRTMKFKSQFAKETLNQDADQSTSKNQSFSRVQAEPSFEQTTAIRELHVGKSESPLNVMDISDKVTAEVEAQPGCSTARSEKPIQDKHLDATPVPSSQLASSHKCMEESSSTQDQLMQNVFKNTPQRRQRFSRVKPKPSLQPSSRIAHRKIPSDDGSNASEDQHMDTASAGSSQRQFEEFDKGSETETKNVSNNVPAETGLALLGDCKQDISTESNSQLRRDQTMLTVVQSTVSETTSTSPVPHEADYSGQRADKMVSDLTDTTETSKKAPGSPLKLKSKLHHSSYPQASQQVQSTKPTQADSSQGVDDRVPLLELRPNDQEPVKVVTVKENDKNSSSIETRSSPGSMTQISTTQNESTSKAEGFQTYSLLSEILPAEVPSDPDEPFFILSLTEIPVSSTGEVVSSVSEHLSHHHETDPSIHQQRVCAESLEAARDESVSNVHVHTSKEESSALINTNTEPAASIGVDAFSHLSNNPIDQGKLQVKATTTVNKQTSPAATLTDLAPEDSDNTFREPCEGSGDCGDSDKAAVTSEKEPDGCSVSQTSQCAGSRRQRNAKDKPFSLGMDISSTVKPPLRKVCKKTNSTPSSAAKKTSSKPKIATSNVISNKPISSLLSSHDVCMAQTSEPTPGPSDAAPSIQCCTTEVSVSQEVSCAENTSEEEPTSLSQFFLSDIFTEVEDG